MEIYLVGGAVRDQLLGEPIKERDWVVVGATPEIMLALGYNQVGKGFPVFLHPQTGEEYALARTERKIGKGYTQFSCYADPSVTLVEDLQRRDLTINAIAQTLDGKLIDPYGGQADLKNHILRHVSAAFVEDPLRILRIARFMARFTNFHIHPETIALMKKIVQAGEIDALVPERVWQEFVRALSEKKPTRFFTTLKKCGALKILFPEIASNFEQAMRGLENVSLLSQHSHVRFAATTYSLSKESLYDLCRRIKVPLLYKNLAAIVINNQDLFRRALNLSTSELLELCEKLDLFRRQIRFHQFLLACESYSAQTPSAEFNYLSVIEKELINISAKPLVEQGLTGLDLKLALHKKRLATLKKLVQALIG